MRMRWAWLGFLCFARTRHQKSRQRDWRLSGLLSDRISDRAHPCLRRHCRIAKVPKIGGGDCADHDAYIAPGRMLVTENDHASPTASQAATNQEVRSPPSR